MVTFDAVPLAAGAPAAPIALPGGSARGDDTLRSRDSRRGRASGAASLAPAGARLEETLFLRARARASDGSPGSWCSAGPGAPLAAAALRRRRGGVPRGRPAAWRVGVARRSTPGFEAGGGLVEAAGRRLGRATARGSRSCRAPFVARWSGWTTAAGRSAKSRSIIAIFAPFRGSGGRRAGRRALPELSPDRAGRGRRRSSRASTTAHRRWSRRPRASGRVLLLAAPLDAVTGDFPLQPAYLPFLRRLAIYASGHEARPPWRIAGRERAGSRIGARPGDLDAVRRAAASRRPTRAGRALALHGGRVLRCI